MSKTVNEVVDRVKRRPRPRVPLRGRQLEALHLRLRAAAAAVRRVPVDHRRAARRARPPRAPDLRPAHGFALQAIGLDGATASETGHRLGITKQAAGKTIDRLAELGYVAKADDDTDRRRKLVRITPRGLDALAMSAAIFDDIRSRWAGTLGPDRLSALEAGLRTMAPTETYRLDVPGWFGA